jgi:aminopeptidase-like protein
MRSKHQEYPEYHTSLDNLDFVTPMGLEGGFNVLQKAIEVIESNCFPKVTVFCEPHLSKHGLYPTLSTESNYEVMKQMMNLIAYSDGKHSLLDIAEIIGEPIWELVPIFQKLKGTVLEMVDKEKTTFSC